MIPASETAALDTGPGAARRKLAIPLLGALALLLGIAFALDLAMGSVSIPLPGVFAALTGGEVEQSSWTTIVLKFRLPKALTAALAGAALAVSGLQMQTLFANPLAGPFVLGISSGASLGVALVVLSVGATGAAGWLAGLGLLGELGLVVAASLGSATVLALVLAVSRRVRGMATILIVGLMVGYVTGAFVNILIYFSVPEQIQAYLIWTNGSFGGVTWSQLRVLAPATLIALVLAYSMTKPLNLLLLGETQARTLGLGIKQARLFIMGGTSLLAGAVTAFCGPIAFIDIAVPHLCRGLFRTADHRVLIPAVALMGATLALVADLISQVPGGQVVLPLNAVTALVGAPVVALVILRQQRRTV